MDGLWGIRWLLYPAPNPPTYTEAHPYITRLPGLEPVFIGRVEPTIPPHGERRRHAPILYSHGNGEDLGACLARLGDLANATGRIVYGWEYPGYGPSQLYGYVPSAAQIKEWALRVFDHIVNLHADTGIIVYGRSLGTGPSCWLASQRAGQIRGIVLQSPFTTIRALAALHVHWTLDYLAPNVFDNVAALQGCGIPLLALHGARDTLIPPEHTRDLLQLAYTSAARTWHIAEQADHNTWAWDADVFQPMIKFMDGLTSERVMGGDLAIQRRRDTEGSCS